MRFFAVEFCIIPPSIFADFCRRILPYSAVDFLRIFAVGTCGNNYAHIAIATVATSESVFLIPHFASTEVIPAKNADKTAITSHI